MRIIGGSAGGRKLKAPPGMATRPTSDRVREALFSILGPPPEEAFVLDLFAGSGGLGLEAISRGATHATFADQSNPALQTLKANIKQLGWTDQTEVIRIDAIALLKRLSQAPHHFHWIFIDPPYASGLAIKCLDKLGGDNTVLHEDGIVIVEHDRRHSTDDAYGCLVKTGTRRYGDTCVSFYERNSE